MSGKIIAIRADIAEECGLVAAAVHQQIWHHIDYEWVKAKAHRPGWFTGTVDEIAVLCPLSGPQVRRAADALVDAGLLDRQKFRAAQGDHTLSYRPIQPEDRDPREPLDSGSDEIVKSGSDESGNSGFDESGDSSSSGDDQKTTTTPTPPGEGHQGSMFGDSPMADRPERSRRSRQRQRRELDPLAEETFGLWWDRYPRKGRGGPGSKDRARVAWAKQVDDGATAQELDRQLTNYRLARQCFESLTSEPCWLMAAPKFLKERRFEFDAELDEAAVREMWNIQARSPRQAPAAVKMDRVAYVEWMAADEAGRRAIESRLSEVA